MPFFTLNFLGEKYTTVGTRHLFSYLCCRAGLHTHLNDKYFAKLLMQSSESRRIPYFLIRKLLFFEFGNPKVTVHKGAETIQGRKLFMGGNYMRKYGSHLAVGYTVLFFYTMCTMAQPDYCRKSCLVVGSTRSPKMMMIMEVI